MPKSTHFVLGDLEDTCSFCRMAEGIFLDFKVIFLPFLISFLSQKQKMNSFLLRESEAQCFQEKTLCSDSFSLLVNDRDHSHPLQARLLLAVRDTGEGCAGHVLCLLLREAFLVLEKSLPHLTPSWPVIVRFLMAQKAL